MINFRKTISQLYFDSVNTLFKKLSVKLNPQASNNKGVDIAKKSAQETFFRILVLLIPLVTISFLISFISDWEILLYNSLGYSFLIYIAAVVLALCGFFLVGEHSNIKAYKIATRKWNRLNLSKSEKKKEVQSFFYDKHNRDLRYGEMLRIINKDEKGISFRYDDYIYNDRILFLKVFFYGPLLNNWDDSILFSKLAKVSVISTVFLLGPVIFSLSYLFQEKLVNTLHWYITRGITSPLEKNQEKGKAKQKKLKEADLVVYKKNGQVHKWTDFSKNFILNKYDEYISDPKLDLSPKECRKKARKEFSDKFSHILKKDSEPTLKTIWEWIEY